MIRFVVLATEFDLVASTSYSSLVSTQSLECLSEIIETEIDDLKDTTMLQYMHHLGAEEARN